MSRSRVIGWKNDRIVLKFDRHLGSAAAELRYWKNHVDYIFENASLLLYYIAFKFSHRFFNYLLFFYYIHFKMWNIYCWKTNAENIIVTIQSIYKHRLSNTNVLHVCRPTLQHVILHDWDSQLIFQCNHLLSYTPFDKGNGRFFSDAKINMMPSSNLHHLWWVYLMHVRVHFPCKIYWTFGLTLYPRGSKDGECTFFENQVWIIVNFMQWNLTDSDEIFQTSNLRRFLNFTQIS